MSVILASCKTGGPVTSIDTCLEVAFVDGAEGACTNTVSHKAYLVGHEEWIKMRPKMIMVRASDWNKIKLDWLKFCRMALRDGGTCNVVVSSVDKAINQLTSIIGRVRK